MYSIKSLFNSSYLIISCLALFTSLLIGVQSVWAMPTTELDGYAWSSNIGWISLNCKTGGINQANVCGTSNYKVTIGATGAVTGYAWSSNIGWIKFGGLSAYPPSSGNGTSRVDARVTGTYPALTFEGWARACAGTNNPDNSESKNCSTMTINDNSGGWDGWISLKGTEYGIRTDINGLSPTSYVWGSDVVGWVDMSTYARWLKPEATLSVVAGNGICSKDCKAMTNICTVNIGEDTCKAKFNWDFTNTTSQNVENLNLTTSDRDYGNTVKETNVERTLKVGDNRVIARTGSQTLSTLDIKISDSSCADGGVVTIVDGAPGATCEYPPPSVTMSLDKKVIRSGDKVEATWTMTPSPADPGTTCKLGGPGLTDTVNVSGKKTSSALTSKSRFSIVCNGSYGKVEASAEVEVVPTAKEV